MHLELNQVQFFVIPLDDYGEDQFFGYLSPDEKSRQQRIKHFPTCKEFVVTRGVLRFLLGEYLHCHPAEVKFAYTAKGKPFLPTSSLQFNVSHSYGVAIFAFTLDFPLGVDVEYCSRIVAWERLLDRYFTASEQQWIQQFPSCEQKGRFWQLWTLKEALLKATGEGLSGGLDQFSIVEYLTDNSSLWQFYTEQVLPDYRGSIVVEHHITPRWERMSLGELTRRELGVRD